MLFVWIRVLPVWLVRACERMCGERECVANEYVFRKSVYVWRNEYMRWKRGCMREKCGGSYRKLSIDACFVGNLRLLRVFAQLK